MFELNLLTVIGVWIILLNFCSTDEGPSIISMPLNKILDVGDTLELNCQVENIDNHFVIWAKLKKWEKPIPITVGNQLVFPDTRFSLAIDNNTQTYTLKIVRVEPNDAAIYECYINVIDGNTERNKQQVDVAVRQAPQITYKSTNSTTLELGQSDDLLCTANGFPTPQIIWRRENNKILPIGGHRHFGSVLPLQNVTKYDRGIYICEAENGSGAIDRKLIEVKVIFPPHVATKIPKMGQALGHSIKLFCAAEGYPTVFVDWKRNGQIIRNDNKYWHEFNGYADNTVQSSLTIPSLNEAQYGDYYCEASNVLGVAAKRIHIFQTKKPVNYK